MVELHGWAMLRENYAADDEESHIEQIVASLMIIFDVYGTLISTGTVPGRR